MEIGIYASYNDSVMTNILSIPFLRNILFVCLAIAIVLPIYSVSFVYPSFTKLLTESTENDAIRVATHLARRITPDHAELTRNSLSDDLVKEIEVLREDVKLEKLQIFSKSGEVIYSSDPKDIGSINRKEYFYGIVAKGSLYTNMVKKDTTSSDGQIMRSDVVEVYVPLMRGDTFIGAFEIYYDITIRKEKLDKLLSRSITILFAMVSGLLIAVIIALYNASQATIERMRTNEELMQYRDHLEELVEARTVDLKHSNEQLDREIVEHERAEGGLRIFGRYVTPEIRDKILDDRIPLNGEKIEATVLFADLRDFTRYVEETDPEEVIRSIRAYFTAMQRTIRRHQGLVIQYAGDEIEAAFGVPLPYEDHAAKAVQAALEMRRSLEELNNGRVKEGKMPFRHGIGIHTGELLAGNTGSEDQLSYALIGDTVNLAARLQDLNKGFGTDIILSATTRKHLDDSFELKELTTTEVKGKTRPVEIFTLA